MRTAAERWIDQATQNPLVAVMLLFIVLIPLASTPFDDTLPGVAAGMVAVFGLIVIAGLLWRSNWSLHAESLVHFFKTGANTPVLLFLFITVVGCFTTVNLTFSLNRTLVLCACVGIYFGAAYQIRRTDQLTKVMDAFILTSLLVCLTGLFDIARNDPTNVAGSLGENELFGALLLILLPFQAVVAVSDKSPNRQLAAEIGVVLSAALLLLSHANSSIFGAGAGLLSSGIFTVYAVWRKGKLNARKHELTRAIMMLVVSILAAIGISLASSSFDELRELKDSISPAEVKSNQQYAINLMRRMPLKGYGPGTYLYLNLSKQKRDYHNPNERPVVTDDAQSLYLQTAAETGLPGLICLVAAIVCVISIGIRRMGRMDAGIRQTVLIGAVAATIGFVVDAAVNPAWSYPQISVFFWLVLGLGTGMLRPHTRHAEMPARNVPEGISRCIAVLLPLSLCLLMPSVKVSPRAASMTINDTADVPIVPGNPSKPETVPDVTIQNNSNGKPLKPTSR